MAKLTTENKETISDLSEIQRILSPLQVKLFDEPLPSDSESTDLLGSEKLTDEQKESLLKKMDGLFERLQSSDGIQSRDLIVLHSEIPGLGDLLSKFDKCHTHDDFEIRYIVDGDGVFGFVLPDGKQVELEVGARDFIHVPANTEHWFKLTDSMRIKAVRYFAGTDGWVPNYTDTKIKFE